MGDQVPCNERALYFSIGPAMVGITTTPSVIATGVEQYVMITEATGQWAHVGGITGPLNTPFTSSQLPQTFALHGPGICCEREIEFEIMSLEDGEVKARLTSGSCFSCTDVIHGLVC